MRLDNDFYGAAFALSYDPSRLKLLLGGAWNRYDGDHFNEITWARYAMVLAPDYRYEDDNAVKTDFNVYIKGYYELFSKVSLMADLQVRNVTYRFTGMDALLSAVPQKDELSFFNPKAGLNYQFLESAAWYFSVSRASKEPSRDDYTETTTGSRPKPEYLTDFESGIRYEESRLEAGINFYRMTYTDQLVLTGKVNDVGNYTRINVPSSYRQGAEVEFRWRVLKTLHLRGNATWSENRIKAFDEYIDNYDASSQELVTHRNTSLAFSPAFISSGGISLLPLKNLTVEWITKHVGKQYLDNASSQERKINEYTVSDLHINYSLHFKILKEIRFTLSAYNVFSKKYVSNGYTFSYISGGSFITENYYYPQAPAHYMAQVTIKF